MLDVWREACRHIQIEESTAAIAALLPNNMPIAALLVRRIDRERCCLETAAIAAAAGGRPAEVVRTPVTADQMHQLLAWCETRERLHGTRNDAGPAVLRWIVPEEVQGDVLAGPLGSAAGPLGVVLLVARAGRTFAAAEEKLLSALLEPFSVALENDHRLREMASLREAAEADRSSLLTRLGRQTLGDTIIGDDSGLRSVMQRVELVARSDAPVLIFGATGTGKELVARAIHVRSPRAAGPFMRINCGAIPVELIDSQLFGHERGSFTGAADTHRGWFERADCGTLFLDEIGELPAAAQVRLLRVLQDGIFERVGGQQSITVDVRIVAATHRDLSGMVRDGKFREDLWYRLAVFPIALPTLRERPEDIPDLSRHFAQRAAVRFGLTPRDPSTEDIALLVAYPWPGNVRELASVMDRAAILGDGATLEVAKALGVQTGPTTPELAAPPAPRSTDGREPAGIVSLDEAMRLHIEAALVATQGRIEGPQGVASLLKINPHTLRARMRKLGIDWKKHRGG